MASKSSNKCKKQNPGVGIEYEVYVPAYFALKLNSCEEVEDFTFRSNAEGFGNLDDLIIDVKTKDEMCHFGFQLKHKQEDGKLIPSNFEATKGDFSLKKYCQSFKTLDEEQKKYHFILYTNKDFNPNRTKDLKTFKIFEMSGDDGGKAKKFFDTSDEGKVYKFRMNEDEEDEQDYNIFLSHFTVFPGQKNYLQLEKEIKKILNYEEQFSRYIEFFRKWHRGDFSNKILDKKTINLRLFDIFMSSLTIKDLQIDDVENLELLERVMQEFDITIFESQDVVFIKKEEENCVYGTSPMDKSNKVKELLKHFPHYAKHQLESYAAEMNVENVLSQPEKTMECLVLLAKDFKFINAKVSSLNPNDVLKLLYYLFGKPLVLNFNENSKNVIHKGIELCDLRDTNVRIALMGQEIDSKRFSKLCIFSNLQELRNINDTLFEEVIKKCSVSLQGRNEISVEKLMKAFNEIPQIIGAKELLRMLQRNYLVGEEKEILPSYYMNRVVSTYFLHKEAILQHCLETKELVIIYYQKTIPAYFFLKKNLDVMEINAYINNPRPLQRGTILLTTENCYYEHFATVCEKNNKRCNIQYLKMVNEDLFFLIMSTKNTFKMDKIEKKYIEENFILDDCNNPVSIVCSAPGTGKSTLLKSLKNECPSEWWVFSLDLKTVNNILKKKLSIEEFLKNVMKEDDMFSSKLKDIYLKYKKMIVFMDGLDEIETENVKMVIRYTKDLSKLGYRVWLFTRQNLQKMLMEEFHLFMIDIADLSEEQQEKFVEKRLRSKYGQEDIEEIRKKIFANADIAHNRKILGIPLQLHIITEIFLNDVEQVENISNFFVLTKMYRILFEGRYRHFVNKSEPQIPHSINPPDGKMYEYKIAALNTVFDEQILNELNLKRIVNQNKQILEHFRRKKDVLGIISFVDDRNKAVFEHFTFAEYFACVYLVEHWDVTRILKTHLFDEGHQNLLTFFNIMLAEEQPLHLALIYKDVKLLRNFLESEDSKLDKGGRNLFHLLASMGTKQSVKDIQEIDVRLLTQLDSPFLPEESHMIKHLSEILIQATNRGELQKDKIFQWTPLDYALFSGSLFVADKILYKFDEPENLSALLQRHYSESDIFYYSIRFSYVKILSAVIRDPNFDVQTSTPFSLGFIFDSSVLSESQQQMEVIQILISEKKRLLMGIEEEDDVLINFFLSYAVKNGNTTLTRLLLEEGADVNCEISTLDHKTLIFLANSAEMVKLLVDAGADVNAKDVGGNNVLNFFAVEGRFDEFVYVVQRDVPYDGKTLLKAAQSENEQIVELLIRGGINVNVRNKKGETPLYLAVAHRRLSVVELLLEQGADVNLTTKEGNNVLHLCATGRFIWSHLRIFILLLNKASHLLSKVNHEGATPFHLAVYNGQYEMVNIMFNKRSDLDNIVVDKEKDPLRFVTTNGRLDKEKVFQYMDVTWKSKYGNDYYARKASSDNDTLWLAVKAGSEERVEVLLNHGHDIDAKNENGETPLHIAVRYGQVAMVQLLLRRWADVDVLTNNGDNVLHYSIKYYLMDSSGMIFVLLLKRASHLLSMVNNEGVTPFHLAVYECLTEVVEKVFNENLSLEEIDVYNDEYPLHFVTKDGVIQREAVFDLMNIIRSGSNEGTKQYYKKFLKTRKT